MASPEPAKSIARLAMSVALRWGLGPALVSLAFVLAQTFAFFHQPQPFSAFALSAIAIAFWYSGTKPGIFTALVAWLVHVTFLEPDVSPEARLLNGLVFLIFALVMTLVMRARAAEKGIREGEYKLHHIIDTVPALLWSTGLDGEPTYVNQRMLDYSGMRFEDFKHGGWEAFVHPADFPETAKAFYQAIQTGTSYQGAFRLRRADGEFRWHHARCEPLRDRHGRIIHWYGVTVDIDEVKNADEQPRSAAQLQATLNVIPAYAWYAAPSGGLTFVNRRTADYLGLPNDHPLRFGIDIGAPWDAHVPFLHPDDQEGARNAWPINMRTGEASEYSFRVRNAQGGYRWFLARVEPLRANDGTLLQWVGVNLDIEELKGAEQALREGEYKLRKIIEAVPGLVWSTGSDGEPTHVNQRILDYSGMRFEDFLHLGWKQFLHPDDFSATADAFAHAIQTGTPYQAVHRLRRTDGEYRWHHARGEPLRDGQGRIIQWYGLSVDIDEGKKAEDQLRRSEANLAEAQRLSHTGSWGINPATSKILYWSEECYRIWGFDLAQGLPYRATVFHRIHPDDRDRVYKETLEASRQKRDHKIDFRIVLPDGTVKHLEAIGHHLFAADGELVQIVGTNIDVTERKHAEQALRESEGKFRDYAETASDWFWEIDPDHKFTLLTENAFGSHAVDRIGTACWDLALDLETEPEKWRLVRATLESRQPFRDFVYCSARHNDSPIYVKASGKPVFGADGEFRGYRGTGTDVTGIIRAQEEHDRLRELESHLARMNRVGVMGELAASLVHEITQPIATARNNARAAMNFLARNPPDLGEVSEALACVVGDTDRAGKIIDGVRGHIKKAPLQTARFDLNDAIKEVIALARTAIVKNDVAVHTRLVEGPLAVEGDRVQVQQVALNLILNAVEAMGSVETGARDLSISTEQSQPNVVLVAVRDSGLGIDPKDLERVFETFYTTKSGGVGLGLSISRSIVAAHGGRLWADVNAPRGAVFQFTLPGAANDSTKDSTSLPGQFVEPERRTETLQQTHLVNGLPKVPDDPIVERAGPVGVVGRPPTSCTAEAVSPCQRSHIANGSAGRLLKEVEWASP